MGAIKKLNDKIFEKANQFFSPEHNELRRIRKLPRYQKGRTRLFGFEFDFVDPASFVGQYQEIFDAGTFSFNSNEPQPYIIDCGANIGLSVLYFKQAYPQASITAFEADPTIFAVLKKNVANIEDQGIKLINKGVWNEKGKISFLEEGSAGGHILEGNATSSEGSKIIQIETTSLRSYIDRKVDFLKIDIEGAELVVLEDCADLLYRVDRIFLEYHSVLGKPQELHRLLEILSMAGFRYYIKSVTLHSDQPFIHRKTIDNYDNLLSIYAYRKADL